MKESETVTKTTMKDAGAEVRLIPVLSVAPDKVPHFVDCLAESEALDGWLKEHQGTATNADFQAYMTAKTKEGKNPVGMMAELLRAVFVAPAAVAADDVAAVRDALGLCREAVSRNMKKHSASDDALAQWKECRTMLSHLQALTFPDVPGGEGARSRWLHNGIDVKTLPAVARCYLHPNAFTRRDKMQIRCHLEGLYALLETLSDKLRAGKKPATVGFSEEEINTALIVGVALRGTMPYPCEDMAEKGYRYFSAEEYAKASAPEADAK